MTMDEFNAEGCTGYGNDNDMLFRSFLSGPDGAYFELLKEKHHTDVDITRAKDWIRNNRDATSIKIVEHKRQPKPLA